MESKKYIAYNKTRESSLSLSVTSINATLDPLRVLKVLIEGLPENARNGLWLTNFKGVPVAHTLSPFDLIYLDKDLRVVHGVELVKDGEFVPFRGNPASALVLPSRSITASATRDGDQLELRVIETSDIEAIAVTTTGSVPESVASEQKTPAATEPVQVTRFYSPTILGSAQPVYETPNEQLSSANLPHPASEAESTTLSEPKQFEVASHLAVPAHESLEMTPVADETALSAKGTKRRLVTGPILASHKMFAHNSAVPAEEAPAVRTPIPFPSASTARPSTLTAHEAASPAAEIPISLFPQLRGSAKPQKESPETASHPSVSLPISPATIPQVPAPNATPIPQVASPTQASQAVPSIQITTLAATIAPPVELPPSETPQRERFPDHGPVRKPKFSWKIRILRWLFPDLIIHEVTKPHDRRRADRQSLPGLIAYFFTGGAPEPHKVGNISVTGFYLHTEERWMPGTVIRMTLQKLGSKGEDPSDTITVNSKIVRWGPDGEGFEFILTDLED